MIANNNVDVLLLDISVPNSAVDANQFPVLHVIPRLLHQYPKLNILVISMFTQPVLIEALVDVGISGYIFKDDQASIQQLDKIVRKIANSGIYFSEGAYKIGKRHDSILTARQLEALSLCASSPDGDTMALAGKLGITGSTMRNLLSSAYLRLGVRTRAAAIARANQLGILPTASEFPTAAGNSRTRQPAKRKQRYPKRVE
jgi:DNA-binding NarL/FixJ family response regulator